MEALVELMGEEAAAQVVNTNLSLLMTRRETILVISDLNNSEQSKPDGV